LEEQKAAVSLMDDIYDEKYYAAYCHVGCHRTELWSRFWGNIADGIIAHYNPQTVLDAGCAWGFLVGALRERGIQAYGVDISEYAMSQADESISEYVQVGSVTDLPDRHYDVITFIEVAEHLTAEDGARAIERITRNTDAVLFSSTPFDDEEPTHINVQPFSYWWRIFRKNGFIVSASKSASFVNREAVWFVRAVDD